jgi:voltage-gated potassium channel Kch
LCVVLGLLVRYRDVRALLTTPDVDRARARRLGGAVVFCGLLTVPLAAALWFRAETAVVVTLALGTSVVSLLAVGVAYR